MARIILGYQTETEGPTTSLREALQALEHEVIVDDEIVGDDPNTSFVDDLSVALLKADAFVTIYENPSSLLRDEIRTAVSYGRESGRLLPIVLAKHSESIPAEFEPVTLRVPEGGRYPSLAPTISERIASFQGKLIAQQQRAAEAAARLEANSSDYIDDVIATQKREAANNSGLANIWYVVGFLSLLAGVIVVFIQFFTGVKFASNASIMIFEGLKTLAAIGLLSACARYSFTLGKSYSNESLKNVDRIHAISFGRFYLRAFGTKATWPEVKDVFEHWNIDRASAFSKIDASNFDPRLVELFSDMLKTAIDRVTPIKVTKSQDI